MEDKINLNMDETKVLNVKQESQAEKVSELESKLLSLSLQVDHIQSEIPFGQGKKRTWEQFLQGYENL